MAKGGRYLKKKEKKGRGVKIALSVFLVLALIVGGLAYFVNHMLNKTTRAEYEDKGSSVEDIMDAATFNPDALDQEQTEAPLTQAPAESQETGAQE